MPTLCTQHRGSSGCIPHRPERRLQLGAVCFGALREADGVHGHPLPAADPPAHRTAAVDVHDVLDADLRAADARKPSELGASLRVSGSSV